MKTKWNYPQDSHELYLKKKETDDKKRELKKCLPVEEPYRRYLLFSRLQHTHTLLVSLEILVYISIPVVLGNMDDNDLSRNGVVAEVEEQKGSKMEDGKLKQTIEALEQETQKSEKLEREVGELKRTLEEVSKRTLQLESDGITLNEELYAASEEVEELKKDKAEREVRVRELERKVGALEVRETEEKSKRRRSEELTKEKIAEIGKLTDELRKREGEIEELEKKLGELSNDLGYSEAMKKEVEAKIEKMQGEKTAEIGKFTNELRQMETKIEEMQNKGDDWNGEHWPQVAVASAAAAILAASSVCVVFYLRSAGRT
ncbi:hypothetical protein K2173_023307 [Erythroxylum novogranatense]|uniref:Uncharacterized protein n=1 Tax=Erythroxylum novogranatense TaxID=1862640 RepID=A0AAV8T8H7_9ROSI|nr:hypothetical protein K2173_023307 [Erythroxylum novogranatense]